MIIESIAFENFMRYARRCHARRVMGYYEREGRWP